MALCVGAAVLFGVVHDQVTARVCIEYFTIGHPRLFASDSPTLHGLAWGVLATWWVGAILGIALALPATLPPAPVRPWRSLVRRVVRLLVVTGAASAVSGLVGWRLAHAGVVVLFEPLSTRVPADRHVPFLADLWAHSAAYFVAFVGGLVLIVRAWRERAAAGEPS